VTFTESNEKKAWKAGILELGDG